RARREEGAFSRCVSSLAVVPSGSPNTTAGPERNQPIRGIRATVIPLLTPKPMALTVTADRQIPRAGTAAVKEFKAPSPVLVYVHSTNCESPIPGSKRYILSEDGFSKT